MWFFKRRIDAGYIPTVDLMSVFDNQRLLGLSENLGQAKAGNRF
jgi:hypothetical protein